MTKQPALSTLSAPVLQQFALLRSALDTKPSPPGRGRPVRVGSGDIIAGLAWHIVQPAGTFARNLCMLTGLHVSDSSLSQRRQSLGVAPWEDTLKMFLRPMADPLLHPDAFYKGFRLKGVDGSTFNVANTPPMKRRAMKTRSRRGRAAFHRLGCVALVELGTHAPLALRVGQHDESESALAADIIKELNGDDLLVGDRYYGYATWVARFEALPQHPQFLLRVQSSVSANRQRRLADGSWIVTVTDGTNGASFTHREIKAYVRRPGKRWVKTRFWTNLMDHKRFPAKELLALYALRWEQEIAFREIKHYLHDDTLLLSHTPVTAAQEIHALFMAQAIVARQRLSAGNGHGTRVLQISFGKTLNACRNLCWLMSVAGELISSALFRKIALSVETQLAEQATVKRRKRSCPRKVRQPIKKWHRLLDNKYDEGSFQYRISKSWS